jgi:hypothetical protein
MVRDWTWAARGSSVAGDYFGSLNDMQDLLLGDTFDDNARDYYKKAKATANGLYSLSIAQRLRLTRLGLDGATGDDDEAMIVGLLAPPSNSAHVVPVIDAVGWRRCWDKIDGAEQDEFDQLKARP